MIGAILTFLGPVVDKFFDNQADKDKFKAELFSQLASNEAEIVKAQSQIITAEAKGESWLQRNWRPILMLSIVSIVVNNYLIVPWANFLGTGAPVLELPSELFNLMTVGVGGYIVGRSGEKIMKEYKK